MRGLNGAPAATVKRFMVMMADAYTLEKMRATNLTCGAIARCSILSGSMPNPSLLYANRQHRMIRLPHFPYALEPNMRWVSGSLCFSKWQTDELKGGFLTLMFVDACSLVLGRSSMPRGRCVPPLTENGNEQVCRSHAALSQVFQAKSEPSSRYCPPVYA